MGRLLSGVVELRCERARFPIAPIQTIVNQSSRRIEIGGIVVVFNGNLVKTVPSVQRPLDLTLPSQSYPSQSVRLGGWTAQQRVSPFFSLPDQMGRAFANLKSAIAISVAWDGVMRPPVFHEAYPLWPSLPITLPSRCSPALQPLASSPSMLVGPSRLFPPIVNEHPGLLTGLQLPSLRRAVWYWRRRTRVYVLLSGVRRPTLVQAPDRFPLRPRCTTA